MTCVRSCHSIQHLTVRLKIAQMVFVQSVLERHRASKDETQFGARQLSSNPQVAAII
jgi:hypothetical protein